jgi:beta-N-acetylhexosaminidase
MRLTLVCVWLWLAASPPVVSASGVQPQSGTVAALMAKMTPKEKVGQLFLVTFYGPAAGEGTEIANLIVNYHVGGVALLAANDNITETTNVPLHVLTLVNQLQSEAITATQTTATPNGAKAPPFIPLFIAINHEGDGYPFTEIRSGMTALPDAMAMGATWDPEQAQTMGAIAGEELAALGINLLLGPSLDVLDTPRPLGSGDLGPRAFGGDPFWVSGMGQAYIRGVHTGSQGKVAVVSKHFPGQGGSDRRPEEEVSTVRKSLEQLKQIELAPFFAVTGNAPDPASTTDALLTAHIRFQGFQGNIRQTTRPVSFDQQAFAQLLALPELVNWRANGGVTISDSLGVRAVKRFYDPAEQTFNHRIIARDAFLAGNDILFLSEFGLLPRADQTSKIIDTLTFFTQQYEADQTFAKKVDEAVARILSLKLRLYGPFDPAKILQPESGLQVLGQGGDKVFTLAQNAVTLISPTIDELAARVPQPPSPTDRIVFFTDTRLGRQCSTCPPFPLLDKRALELTVLQRYGPQGSKQIREGYLLSFTFDELANYLNVAPTLVVGKGTPTPEPLTVGLALDQANWVVFAMLNVSPEVTASGIVSRFLAERPDIPLSKKVIIFAFNAPYYLDTTDLSKLTAFYALYSKTPAFVDVAARLLFFELVPKGASPVSVSSVGYDLIEVTAPDPKQIIEICLEGLACSEVPHQTPVAPATDLRVGDSINLATSVIRDLNGHPVPDDTLVRFSVTYQSEGLAPTFVETKTKAGVAMTSLTLDHTGQLEITASSEPAFSSITLQINVQKNEPSVITTIVPTPGPSDTPEPTVTVMLVTATPSTPKPLAQTGRVVGRDFFMLFLGLIGAMVIGYRLGNQEGYPTRGIRVALAGAIGVLLGYNFFALALPGADLTFSLFGIWAASMCVFLGAGLGLAAGWYWFVRRGNG